ncbi:ABC transporter ATP-binding protein/permease [Candidatus Synechococcus calcipolaris G9]|uniref:ABC transporter ATP-binding protein/permease n=1 Tax=Candidatus Synechococcus calcipolaris G9 TaxID=1497997 RepID=A0ABT6EZQ3_9SYNE|nr:ABC transporter ATP-binding protein [Candidatus Synechococcus calcipolaris]MDG2991055.1 ABC transporter ATP-binding protein/permease [Candidatus Synechococcus calcipolaris G9]
MVPSLHPFARLLTHTRQYQTQVWQASACSVLNKIFDLAPPVLIGIAVDIVVEQQDSILARWGLVSARQQLLALALVSFLIWSLESLFEYAYDRLWRNLAQQIQHDLRLDAYSHLQEMELAYFEDRSSGVLLSILNDDINQLERFLDQGANEILQVTTTVIVIGAIFFFLAPTVTIWAMLPMPFILWGSIIFQRRLAPRYAQVREKAGLLNERLANNLAGMQTIKSFTAEEYELERLRLDSLAYRQSNRGAIALSAAYIPLIRFVILFGFTGTLILGGFAAIAGRLDVGAYSVMVFLIQRLLWPLTRLGETLDQYQRAMASSQRVMNLLNAEIRIHPGHRVLVPQDVKGELRFEQVSFAYGGRDTILHSIDLYVPASQTIAIVGATGSGKSTLAKLLLRFYEIHGGRILLDGIEIHELRLKDLRAAIGLVSQDVFLFHGTVYDNIAYGTFEATLAEVITAAKMAEADEFIRQLPQGYDTVVGERGQKLSGGQRQRLAIARAILKDPPILVLDEATSAVDNETEAAIQRSLAQITQHRTTIAIAHRLSTIRHADRIYVMDAGRFVEQGTHEELIELAGIYSHLWDVQTGHLPATLLP